MVLILTKAIIAVVKPNVAFGSTTVLAALKRDFRSAPETGHRQTGPVDCSCQSGDAFQLKPSP
jgi:hypothetical protein